MFSQAAAWNVFLAALLTALATGLGALPFLLIHKFSRRWLGIFNALAGGLMLGACYGLINEGVAIDLAISSAGVIVGLVAISYVNKKLEGDKSAQIVKLRETGGAKALLIIGVMTIHSFAEGIGLGVAYGGGETLGGFITLALAIHNIPEGLAISLVLVPRGTTPLRASLWSIISSLPQPLMAVPAFILVSLFTPFLPFGLGLASGAMLWLAFAELIPDALEDVSHSTVATVVTVALTGMIVLQTLL
jgi:ZIP family zinc transporter